ncbi:hypothetical protein CDAR_560481 [Caerostris darwini]|uniref:Uncharacterized protein n=1 Tax=Caerostris darwini TaxID=1538125 RepID=A0AAV4W1Z0_9ARAC|nr:hypothetical protein CDAR_560221 [Caerostris darwini]GIY75693.1 hypothetical protein CDAR_560481 [Caerostris darwini]
MLSRNEIVRVYTQANSNDLIRTSSAVEMFQNRISLQLGETNIKDQKFSLVRTSASRIKISIEFRRCFPASPTPTKLSGLPCPFANVFECLMPLK